MPKKRDIWKQIIQILQSRHQGSDITPWFSNTQLSSLASKNAIIKVPNRFVRIRLRDPFLKDMQEAFAQLCGSSPEILCSYTGSAVCSAEQPINHQVYTSLFSILHPENKFSSFIVDSKNRFAHAAALSLSQNPSSPDPCKEILGISLKEIGSILGKMNHSNVLYRLKNRKNINYNRQTFQKIRELKKIITYC